MPEQKDNQGALFKNDKGDNDKRPDYRGPLTIKGEEGELAAWISKSKQGQTYMSLKWQPKDDKPQGGGQQASGQGASSYGGSADLDETIPFAPIRDLP